MMDKAIGLYHPLEKRFPQEFFTSDPQNSLNDEDLHSAGEEPGLSLGSFKSSDPPGKKESKSQGPTEPKRIGDGKPAREHESNLGLQRAFTTVPQVQQVSVSPVQAIER